MIDWTDPTCKVSDYFTVKDAIYLPGWRRLTDSSDGFDSTQQDALIQYFAKLDRVRQFLGVPILTHCALRPPVYNSLIDGAAPGSAHMARNIGRKKPVLIAASDWHPEYTGLSIVDSVAKAEKLLIPFLADFGLRMEKGRTSWIHTDSKPVPPGGNCCFLP